MILNKSQEYLINNFYIWYNYDFGNSVSSTQKETARGALLSVKWHWRVAHPDIRVYPELIWGLGKI